MNAERRRERWNSLMRRFRGRQLNLCPSCNLVAVYTPKTKISACEITSSGRFVVLALDGCKKLVTLELKGPGIGETPESETYGEEENAGKTFVLPENC
ncbi:unnamed protein product [Diabrotica balteata]|uniref:Uncharacterized protein n=1 Tax=Diabrotica balteata TaxID=107213 RepID=A0A9N9XF97_DIABA|nr:unnamed protein product [Diabrotica balteata]